MKSSTSLAIAHVFTIILFRICYNGASQFQNIGQALGFYGVYHQDPINQLIHFVGVPIIIWSLQLFLVHLTLPPLPLIHHHIPKIKNLPFMPDHDMTYGTISTIGYILLYLKLDWFGGLLYAPFAYMLYATAVSTVARDQIQAQQQAAQQVAHQKTLKSQATNAKLDSRNTTSTGIDNTTCTSWTGTGQVLKMAFVLHFLGWYVQIHPGTYQLFRFLSKSSHVSILLFVHLI